MKGRRTKDEGRRAKGAGRRLVLFVLCPLSFVLLLAGCEQKMAKQPSYKPLDPTSFFPRDGQSARPLVPGTVARGHLRTDLALFSGFSEPGPHEWAYPATSAKVSQRSWLGVPLNATAAARDKPVDDFPFLMTREVLQRGHDRFMIFCVECHDPLGTGRGKIVERGYTAPPTYHQERLRTVPVGHFFNVMTRGYGSMPSYAEQVPPRDRWAIAGYIRALQLSQHFPERKLTDAMRKEWNESGKAGEGQRP
jgi:mono/diheme cytochrome c family protein